MIRFIKNIPGLGPDHIFVKFAFTYPWNKGVINSKSLHRIHWIFINIPAIKVTDNRNPGRIRSASFIFCSPIRIDAWGALLLTVRLCLILQRG